MAAEPVTVEKYQKLLAAYQELKAKNSILKKAVLDSQNAVDAAPQAAPAPTPAPAPVAQAAPASDEVLKNRLRESESKLRKTLGEVESIQFHNQQLTRRVEALQEELEASKKKMGLSFLKSKKPENQKQQEAFEVLDEEFQRKLQENSQLHTQLGEMEVRYRQEIAALNAQLNETRHLAKTQIEQLQKTSMGEKEMIAKYAADRENILRILKDKEQALSVVEGDLAGVRAAAAQMQRERDAHIAHLERDMAAKILFDDTRNAAFNALNVPVGVAEMEDRVSGIIGESLEIVKDFASLFSSLLTYMEERVRHVGAALQLEEGSISEYSAALNERTRVVKPLDRSYTAFHDSGDRNLTEFAADLARFAQYVTSLVALNDRFTAGESNAASATPALRTTNAALHKSFAAVATTVGHLAAAVHALADPASASGAFPRLVHAIATALREMHGAFKALSSQFTSKTGLEHRLPTTSPIIKDTDNCVAATLSKLVMCVGRAVAFLDTNIDSLSGAGFATRGVLASPFAPKGKETSASVRELQEKASRYMALLRRDPPESVPYADALRGKGAPSAASESAQLARQVAELKKQVTTLQHDKEQSALEIQLLTLKLQTLSSSPTTTTTTTTSASSSAAAATTATADSAAATSTGEARGSGDGSDLASKFRGEDASREEVIKQHYMSRVQQLSDQVSFADSKAVTYYEECRAMAHKLHAANRLHVQQNEDIKVLQARIVQLTEDLETTKARYEEQLAMMGEHIMSLNEQLRGLEDSIAAEKKGAAKPGKTSSGKRW